MQRFRPSVVLLLLALLTQIPAQGWTIDPGESVFAVVTHKEGLAARLAHEHLVLATGFGTELVVDAEQPAASSLAFQVAAENLVIDDPEAQAAWQQHLLDLGLLAGPFAELSDKDRTKIRRSMLGEDQLDAARHPVIEARVSEVEAQDGGTWSATLSLTVRDRTVTRRIDFEPPTDGEAWRVEVITAFDFTDFGIEPYSALLGAIRVANSFHVFVRLVATP